MNSDNQQQSALEKEILDLFAINCASKTHSQENVDAIAAFLAKNKETTEQEDCLQLVIE